MPRDTQEAHELFEQVCAPKSSNIDLAKRLKLTYKGFLKISEFQCDERMGAEGEISTVQFVVTTDRDVRIKFEW